jgi:hypothetical protein
MWALSSLLIMSSTCANVIELHNESSPYTSRTSFREAETAGVRYHYFQNFIKVHAREQVYEEYFRILGTARE